MSYLAVFVFCSVFVDLSLQYEETFTKSLEIALRDGVQPALDHLESTNPFPKTRLQHTITFAGDKRNLHDLPSTFEQTEDQLAVAQALLGVGLRRFLLSMRAYERNSVSYHKPAYRKVLNAIKQYYVEVKDLIQDGKRRYGSRSGNHAIKFWSTFYPTLPCYNLERVGTAPDGARFLCNPKSLDSQREDKTLDLVGFGSNNEWDWESSLLDYKDIRIRSIVTLDCTVKPEVITPPSSGQGIIEFRQLCLSDDDRSNMMRLGSIPKTLKKNGLGILKIDVEGWEFRAVPDWFKEDLAGTTTLSVQQIQMEFHRMGWKNVKGSSWESLMNAHLLFLHFYALGFVPVMYERNHIDDCCYEFTYVNTSWYVRAEILERPYQ